MLSVAAAALALSAQQQADATVTIHPGVVGSSSPGYVSFNFDWHLNSEDGWDHNASIYHLNLKSKMLISAATRLSPGAVRIGGSEGDKVIYDVAGNGCQGYDVNPQFCLSMERWKEIFEFTSTTGTDLVFGLNAMSGREGGDPSKPLNLTNHKHFLQYTADNGIKVYGFELGNELPQVPPNVMAGDMNNLRALVDDIYANAKVPKPRLIGPDQNPNADYLNSWLPQVVDAINATTYHNYVAEGNNPKIASEVMTPEYLNKGPQQIAGDMAAYSAHAKSHGIEIWAGEIAACWHSGQANVTNRFMGTFWYADALAARVLLGTSRFCRQAMIGGYYELLDRTKYPGEDYYPNPDMFIAVLFHDLMGPDALNTTSTTSSTDSLRHYAHCKDSQTVLLLENLSSDVPYSVQVPGLQSGVAFLLTAPSLTSQVMNLNGAPLLPSNGLFPSMKGKTTSYPNNTLTLPPHSILFLVTNLPC